MRTEIVCIGTELTSGDRLNTNSQYIARKLKEIGIDVDTHVSIKDNFSDIKDFLKNSIKRSNIVIIAGGLGPTEDDFTKEAVAEVLKKKLIKSKDISEKLNTFFKSINQEMTKNNEKQSLILENSIVLNNKNGTAPAYIIEEGKKKIILLPGPPIELSPIFEEQVIPYLEKKVISKIKVYKKSLKVVGIGESKIETGIRIIGKNYPRVDIFTYASISEVFIQFLSKDKVDVEKVFKLIEQEFKEYIYSYKDISIEQAVFENLLRNNIKVGFCESCTGGLVTSRLTEMVGASKVLDRSVITYSNKSKMAEVDVKEISLQKYGAVSREVSIEMAEGLYRNADIDISVSITGIASPISGSKATGLVYITFITEKETITSENNFIGSRKIIQERANKKVYSMIKDYLVLKDLYKYE